MSSKSNKIYNFTSTNHLSNEELFLLFQSRDCFRSNVKKVSHNLRGSECEPLGGAKVDVSRRLEQLEEDERFGR